MFSHVARTAQIDEAQWQEILSVEPFLELIVARLPLDTFLRFSHPCGMIPPWSRGVKFMLIDITDVEKLSTPGESAQERIVRLLKRDLERRSTGEKQDITAITSPADDGSSDGSIDVDEGSSEECRWACPAGRGSQPAYGPRVFRAREHQCAIPPHSYARVR